MNDTQQTPLDDEAKIRAAALDYIGGVHESDPARMHLVKVGTEWKIINVLWELTAGEWARNTAKARSSEPSWPYGH